MTIVDDPKKLRVRQLQCKFILQSGEFKQGYNTKIIDDNTINALVTKTMSNNFTNSADIIVYGMNDSNIAALSTLGFTPNIYELNHIELYAQYEDDSESLCFKGYIAKAWCDFSDPNRPMHFQCQETYLNSIENVDPINIKGSSDVIELFSNLASKLNLSLQNNGVSGIMNNPILTGSTIDQLKTLSKQTEVNCVVDNGKLKISPKGFSLTTEILNINSESGLLSYPTIDSYGVRFRIRYNPVLNIGQYIALQTKVKIPKATGKWFVYDMQSSLNNRHENWFTDLRCSYNNVDFS